MCVGCGVVMTEQWVCNDSVWEVAGMGSVKCTLNRRWSFFQGDVALPWMTATQHLRRIQRMYILAEYELVNLIDFVPKIRAFNEYCKTELRDEIVG
jgi:hypothetical protein